MPKGKDNNINRNDRVKSQRINVYLSNKYNHSQQSVLMQFLFRAALGS